MRVLPPVMERAEGGRGLLEASRRGAKRRGEGGEERSDEQKVVGDLWSAICCYRFAPAFAQALTDLCMLQSQLQARHPGGQVSIRRSDEQRGS